MFPGPTILFDSRDRLGAVGERRNGVRAAGVEDRRDAGEVGGREQGVIARRQRAEVAGERRGEHDVAHPGDVRGDGGHQHARWVARLSAGGIHAGARDGEDACAEITAVVVDVAERACVVDALAFVESADTRGGGLQRVPGFGREACEGGFAVEIARDERRRAALVERLGEAEDGRVAFFANGGEDRPDVGFDPREIGLAAGAEAIEGVLGVGRSVRRSRGASRSAV